MSCGFVPRSSTHNYFRVRNGTDVVEVSIFAVR